MSSTSLSMEFKEFYGIQDDNEPPENPMDINSSCFDAKLLFNESSKTLSIHQLVSQERSLVADIMSLDNDMQTLVYDNYSKFLNASDVVRTFGEKIDFRQTGSIRECPLSCECGNRFKRNISVFFI